MFAEAPVRVRRLIRFLLLPYCYLRLVNWKECSRSRLQVLGDLAFIFFRFKYYPDNYGACRLYEKNREDWAYYYGSTYNPYPRRRLRKCVQRYEYQIIFNDKELWEKFCSALSVPSPPCFDVVDPAGPYRDEIRSAVSANGGKKIIIKPVMGHAGQGIVLAQQEGPKIKILTGAKDLSLDDFVLTTRSIMQDVVEQDSRVAAIYPHSVNTVRIITLLTADLGVLLLGAKMRFGNNGSFVDNSSTGGINVGLDKLSGMLNEFGCDKHGNRYNHHPATGEKFEGFVVPQWDNVVKLATKVQQACTFYRLVGTDIAVTPNGPVLIEANANPDIIGLELAAGPILKDPEVCNEFKKYNLLINRYQMALHP